jgi:PAS domain S-box-containing protein
MQGNSYTPAMLVVVSSVWLMSLVALCEIGRRSPLSTIDLWLLVTMCAWIFDIALSAVLNGGRFDLGFYAGRLYGLLASTVILAVLLSKTSVLYARLAHLHNVEQQERRRGSAMLRRIFETSLDLFFVVDRQGCLIKVSPSSEAILGYHPTEMIGRSATQFLYQPDLEHTRDEMRKARRGTPMRSFDCRYVHKDGRVVPLSWKGLWSEPDGQHFFVGRDMTERIALEKQLRQAQKMEAIGQLTGGIAHDFNNILAVIIGMTELTAAAVASDPKVSAMLKQIDESAERGAQLVQRMLAFARKQPLEAYVLDINEVVTRSAAILERTLGEHILVETVQGEGLWPALADQSQLEDAIVNLALNARDAMPNGGRLVIETTNAFLDEAYAAQNPEVVAGDYVCINVSDTGTGISPDVIERVFEPFFTTKEVGHGSGLGLSMVYGFVKQSRGHVKIYSELGHGTSIRLYFPRAARTDDASERATTAAPLAVPAGRETVLLVEDDASVRNMAVSALEALGYRVREAADGRDGLAILRQSGPIDLLFTDMIMPNGISGHDLIRAARHMRPNIKALLTSGYSEQFVKAANVPADVRLLGKPYRLEGLATAVRAALDDTN